MVLLASVCGEGAVLLVMPCGLKWEIPYLTALYIYSFLPRRRCTIHCRGMPFHLIDDFSIGCFRTSSCSKPHQIRELLTKVLQEASGAVVLHGAMPLTYGHDLPCSGQCRGQARVSQRLIGRHWLSAWAQPPPCYVTKCIHMRERYTVDFRRSLACQGDPYCFQWARLSL